MKVNLAKSAGFCFGVKRALKIALLTAKSPKEVFMLGEIVHNEDVVRLIEKSGIRKISKLIPGKDKILLIRAHGACQKTIRQAVRLGFTIVNATCPMVKEIHKIARDMEEKGFHIIVIGDKLHDEVRGIIGQLKTKALIIEDTEKPPLREIKKIKKAAVVVQSTQDLEKVLKLADILKRNIKELQVFNTVCMPTRIKQTEIKSMPAKNDAMIVIGSKTSANTKRLYKISKSLNKRTYWVSSEKEISPSWFKSCRSVGVTAGASTPDTTIDKVVRFLKQLG
jgi:4-hydroxy-3-methylbut-2-en-1-yl diphosphate reductase